MTVTTQENGRTSVDIICCLWFKHLHLDTIYWINSEKFPSLSDTYILLILLEKLNRLMLQANNVRICISLWMSLNDNKTIGRDGYISIKHWISVASMRTIYLHARYNYLTIQTSLHKISLQNITNFLILNKVIWSILCNQTKNYLLLRGMPREWNEQYKKWNTNLS